MAGSTEAPQSSGPERKKKICAVAICPSPQRAMYHRFPKSPALQSAWTDATRRDVRRSKVNPECARICENHFREEDYERDLQHELMGLPLRKRLKKEAIPSRNLLPLSLDTSSLAEIPSGEDGDAASRYRKDLSQNLLESHVPSEAPADLKSRKDRATSPLKPFLCEKGTSTGNVSLIDHQTSCDLFQNDHKIQQRKYCGLLRSYTLALKANKRLKARLTEKSAAVAQLHKRIRTLESKQYLNSKIKDFFRSKSFSDAQIKLLMNPEQKWVKGYSKEDVDKALMLKRMSPKAFEYVRKQKLIALPSRRHQQQWLREFKCPPGSREQSTK